MSDSRSSGPSSPEAQSYIDDDDYEDWYDDDGKPLPPITERILRQVAEIICKADENVVIAAKRLVKERDDAVRTIAMLLYEAEGGLTISEHTQTILGDFELSRIDDPRTGAIGLSLVLK